MLNFRLVLRESHARIGIYFFEIYGGPRDGDAVHLTTDLVEVLFPPEIKAALKGGAQ